MIFALYSKGKTAMDLLKPNNLPLHSKVGGIVLGF